MTIVAEDTTIANYYRNRYSNTYFDAIKSIGVDSDTRPVINIIKEHAPKIKKVSNRKFTLIPKQNSETVIKNEDDRRITMRSMQKISLKRKMLAPL